MTECRYFRRRRSRFGKGKLRLSALALFTIWIKAQPEEHMSRVIAQGDFRAMAENAEAMEDLRGFSRRASRFTKKRRRRRYIRRNRRKKFCEIKGCDPVGWQENESEVAAPSGIAAQIESAFQVTLEIEFSNKRRSIVEARGRITLKNLKQKWNRWIIKPIPRNTVIGG